MELVADREDNLDSIGLYVGGLTCCVGWTHEEERGYVSFAEHGHCTNGQCTLAVCDSPGANSLCWMIANARQQKVHIFRIHACSLRVGSCIFADLCEW